MAARHADTRPALTGRAGARIVVIVVDPLARSWVVFHPPPGPGIREGAGGTISTDLSLFPGPESQGLDDD